MLSWVETFCHALRGRALRFQRRTRTIAGGHEAAQDKPSVDGLVHILPGIRWSPYAFLLIRRRQFLEQIVYGTFKPTSRSSGFLKSMEH